jgi:hypothetical protein
VAVFGTAVQMHQPSNVLLHFDSSKSCAHPLHTFVYSFKFVNLFFSNTLYSLSIHYLVIFSIVIGVARVQSV